MKWHREDYLELMTFGRAPRQMFCELFGPLIGLDREWESQGATPDEINMVGFDWDYVPTVGCGGNTGNRHPLPFRVLEETGEYMIVTNEFGMREKLCKGRATIPLPLEYPVRTMDDWLKLKPNYLYSDARIDAGRMEASKKAREEGALVIASIPGGFDLPRLLMGEEELCVAYYEQPELIHDILETVGGTALRVLDRISDRLPVDILSVHEDMAGKSGPLIGPRVIRDFIRPYYRKVWDMLRSKGTHVFSQDSDGNMNAVIDAFLDCGLTQMYPMEPAAGMDVVQLRKKYGNRLAFKGGIDKHVLREDKEAIRRELEYKMQPLMRQGGMVFGLDHRITNGTPIENYRYYVETGREILGLPPRDPKACGWARMAF